MIDTLTERNKFNLASTPQYSRVKSNIMVSQLAKYWAPSRAVNLETLKKIYNYKTSKFQQRRHPHCNRASKEILLYEQ